MHRFNSRTFNPDSTACRDPGTNSKSRGRRWAVFALSLIGAAVAWSKRTRVEQRQF